MRYDVVYVTCNVCGNVEEEQFVQYNEQYDFNMCNRCVISGRYQEYLIAMQQMGIPATREEMEEEEIEEEDATLKNIIDVTSQMSCPSCGKREYNIEERVCTNPHCTQGDITSAQEIRMLLEYNDLICPYCLHTRIDIENKICLGCKGRISQKTMTKALTRKVRENEATTGEKCTICGGNNTWQEYSYCLDCEAIYYMFTGTTGEGDEASDIYGKIDGKDRETKDGRLSRRIEVYRVEEKGETLLQSANITVPDVVCSVLTKSTKEKPKGPSYEENVEIITADSLGKYPVRDLDITLKDLTATVRVRFLEHDPSWFTVVKYEINRFEEEHKKRIPSLLQEIIAKEGKK